MTETTLPKWADNEGLDVLEAFRDYLEKRKSEIADCLDPEHLETGDPYLMGLAQGMRTGLDIAEDLVFSYREWVMREIYHPDARSFKYNPEL